MNNEIKKKVFFLSIGGYISVINKHLSESYPLEPLGKHIKVLGGYAFKSAEYKEDGIPIIRISDFNDEKIDLSSVKYYDESQECDKYELKEDEIIIALTGGTIGKLGIVQKGLGKLYLNQRVGKFQVINSNEFYDRYVYWIARGVQDRVKNLGYGGAQPNISGKQIESMEFPIPKKEEQIGIVNFLKDLRDGNIQDKEYFNKETEKEIIKLQKIQEDIFAGTQNLNLQFEDIQKLHQSILSEAVQGKLVPQDPNDEPASVLLEKIKKEKEKLIKEKKIRKEKHLPPISEDEIPYELPKGWEWVRLGDIITFNYGKGINKEELGGDVPAYGANGILKQVQKPLISNRCLIVGRKGSAGMINIVNEPCWPTDVTYYIEEYEHLDFFYVYYMLSSLKLNSLAYGIKPGLNRNDAYKILIGIPPLNEQKRIVEKVDQLIKFCDELETQVKENQKNSELLMEAVLREAFYVEESAS